MVIISQCCLDSPSFSTISWLAITRSICKNYPSICIWNVHQAELIVHSLLLQAKCKFWRKKKCCQRADTFIRHRNGWYSVMLAVTKDMTCYILTALSLMENLFITKIKILIWSPFIASSCKTYTSNYQTKCQKYIK